MVSISVSQRKSLYVYDMISASCELLMMNTNFVYPTLGEDNKDKIFMLKDCCLSTHIAEEFQCRKVRRFLNFHHKLEERKTFERSQRHLFTINPFLNATLSRVIMD